MRFDVSAITLAGGVALAAIACEKKAEAPAAPPVAEEAAKPAPSGPNVDPTPGAPQAKATKTVQVTLAALGKSGVGGTITFTELPEGGVRAEGKITGLTAGTHGFHVHEHGDCSAPDGASAGPHFNPTAAPHGDVEAAQSHVGDLGNITADASGTATVSVTKKAATLADGAATSLVGRAVIVHKKGDDLKSQPAGDAGDRIACGVIKG
jgi:Cu-Zn family superoxide dismutase